MHDIICPDCGERFLGYDVAFNLSNHILPMLCNNPQEIEEVKQVRFKFYVAEEDIRKSNPDATNLNLLYCPSMIGPNFGEPMFKFIVTGASLYEYILEKSGMEKEIFEKTLEFTKTVVEKRMFKNITPAVLPHLSTLYYRLFSVTKKENNREEDVFDGYIDVEDEKVHTALKVLVHIYTNRNSNDVARRLELEVSIYSARINQLGSSNTNTKIKDCFIPDILHVRSGGNLTSLYKCCKYCGKQLPDEFGYYKMKPVVLLGSHSAGKTSYLLALLYMVQKHNLFITNEKLTTYTLNNDINLGAFQNNIQRYENGLPPEKTDFKNVPILNLRIQDTIYSFIDWPGEKFIDAQGADPNYVFTSRRVLARAAHMLFFIPPEQIDPSVGQGTDGTGANKEKTAYPVLNLQQALAWHLQIPDRRKFRSLMFVINKVDKFKGLNNNAVDLFDGINNRNEVNLYNGQWTQSVFEEINMKCGNFIRNQSNHLFGALNGVLPQNKSAEKHFVCVAPYGCDITANDKSANNDSYNNTVIQHGRFNGVPFLRILKTDNLI